MTFGEILKNKTAFVLDVQQYMDLDPATLDLLMNSTLSNNNLVVSKDSLCHCSVNLNTHNIESIKKSRVGKTASKYHSFNIALLFNYFIQYIYNKA